MVLKLESSIVPILLGAITFSFVLFFVVFAANLCKSDKNKDLTWEERGKQYIEKIFSQRKNLLYLTGKLVLYVLGMGCIVALLTLLESASPLWICIVFAIYIGAIGIDATFFSDRKKRKRTILRIKRFFGLAPEKEPRKKVGKKTHTKGEKKGEKPLES